MLAGRLEPAGDDVVLGPGAVQAVPTRLGVHGDGDELHHGQQLAPTQEVLAHPLDLVHALVDVAGAQAAQGGRTRVARVADEAVLREERPPPARELDPAGLQRAPDGVDDPPHPEHEGQEQPQDHEEPGLDVPPVLATLLHNGRLGGEPVRRGQTRPPVPGT